MAKQVEIHGLKELQQRFAMYPLKYNKVMTKTVVGSMLVLQEYTPAYPQKPETSTYVRKGTLGKSLGVGMGGGRIGQPSIFKIRQVGGMNIQGRFGTNLNYAPRVIGDQQEAPFSSYWWKLSDVPDKAAPKIKTLFVDATDQLAAFIEGKG